MCSIDYQIKFLFIKLKNFYVDKTQHEASSPSDRPQSSFYDDLPFRSFKRPPTQVQDLYYSKAHENFPEFRSSVVTAVTMPTVTTQIKRMVQSNTSSFPKFKRRIKRTASPRKKNYRMYQQNVVL